MICCEDCTRFIVITSIFLIIFTCMVTFLFYCLEQRINRVSQDLKKLKLKTIFESKGIPSIDDVNDLLED